MRIMYVEDNLVNLALVKRVARMGGHEVISFTNGSEALDALKEDTCSLILMDIELEGHLDGIQVVKKLRERGDKRPVIAITAYAMVGDMERILAAGCNEYLPKPVPIAQLLELLARYDPNVVHPDEKIMTTRSTKLQTVLTATPPPEKPIEEVKPVTVTTAETDWKTVSETPPKEDPTEPVKSEDAPTEEAPSTPISSSSQTVT